MTSNTTDRIKKTTLISVKLMKVYSEMDLLETTSKQILFIVRSAKTQGEDRYYQTLSKITDILEKSKNEQEIQENLTKVFPQYQ